MADVAYYHNITTIWRSCSHRCRSSRVAGEGWLTAQDSHRRPHRAGSLSRAAAERGEGPASPGRPGELTTCITGLCACRCGRHARRSLRLAKSARLLRPKEACFHRPHRGLPAGAHACTADERAFSSSTRSSTPSYRRQRHRHQSSDDTSAAFTAHRRHRRGRPLCADVDSRFPGVHRCR